MDQDYLTASQQQPLKYNTIGPPPASTSPSHGERLPTGSVPNASTGAAAGAGASAPRIRRRNRMITSCLECRRRKLRCNKSHPCTNCVKFTRDCVFLAPALDEASQLKLTEIKEKVGSLERLLERDVAKAAAAPAVTSPSQDRALPGDAEDDLPALDDERDLEPTPLAVVDAAYELDGEDDDLLDLGIQMGKMRITERIGGFFRPKISQELAFTMSESPMDGQKETNSLGGSYSRPPEPLNQEWMKPGPAYIAPSSGFFFGQSVQQASLIDFLPSRLAASRLISQYFQAVHPIAQILHRPSFEKEYDTFWDEVSLGIEPPSSVQTIVFAAMFSGVVSMDEPTIIRDFGVSKASLIDNFRLGTETALGRANFLRTARIETLQAFVMYLIPLCRAELSRAHSVLVGAAIRMAECMGLHRDGETYGMNPLETHVRRLIWNQLAFLDIRTCEAQGPRPTIRRDDFDTKLPLNIDDVDLHATGKPPIGADRWTDATFSLIRFEINEMMRTIWVDRPRIERRKISLTAVLSKIETFKANMAAKYDHLIDDRIPVQKCAKVIKALLLSRLHIMVLHRYQTSMVPARLSNIKVASGTTLLETSVTLDTSPDLQPWAWYSGALQQYHTAFLLLSEVYTYPDCKEADRIWACLDYVFECDPSEQRSIKARKVLLELQRRTAIYSSMRVMRAPIAMMEKHQEQRPPRHSQSSDQDVKRPSVYATTPEPLDSTTPPITGRVPSVQFAGVANGESLWAFPNHQSPEASSDSTSVAGQSSLPVTGAGVDDLMADIDWDAFDALFPQSESGELIQPEFRFPDMPGFRNFSGGEMNTNSTYNQGPQP